MGARTMTVRRAVVAAAVVLTGCSAGTAGGATTLPTSVPSTTPRVPSSQAPSTSSQPSAPAPWSEGDVGWLREEADDFVSDLRQSGGWNGPYTAFSDVFCIEQAYLDQAGTTVALRTGFGNNRLFLVSRDEREFVDDPQDPRANENHPDFPPSEWGVQVVFRFTADDWRDQTAAVQSGMVEAVTVVGYHIEPVVKPNDCAVLFESDVTDLARSQLEGAFTGQSSG